MRLFFRSAGPPLDEHELSHIGVVLQELIAETTWFPASRLHEGDQDCSHLSDLIGLGLGACNHTERTVDRHGMLHSWNPNGWTTI